MGAPLSCFRSCAGRAATRPWLSFGAPPGIVKPRSSHGLTGAGFSLIQARVASSICSSGTMSSISPAARAFPWSNGLAGRMTFWSAFCRPSMRVTRVTPPPPGSRPRLTSGRPSWMRPLSDAAILWWQASASSKPPPSAAPLMAATTGLPSCSRRRMSDLVYSSFSNSGSRASSGMLRKPVRSAPANQIFFLALLMMTPVIEVTSASRRSTVPSSEVRKCWFMMLAPLFGSSMVMVTIPSGLCDQSYPVYSVMVFPLRLAR